MQVLVALLLLGQSFSLPTAYLIDSPDGVVLATATGRYEVELGYGCDGLLPPANAVLIPGSGGVATIQPAGTDETCSVQIGAQLSDQPCVTNDAGDCDVSLEQ